MSLDAELNAKLEAEFSCRPKRTHLKMHERPNYEMYQTAQKLRSSTSIQAASKDVSINSNGCCQCFTITASDFGPDFDTTYIILAPGKYVLDKDVVFFPSDAYTPAINILSDNVVLDLCGHTLSQGNSTEVAYGVQIGEGYFYSDPDFVLQNVTVQNGTIRDFTGSGVFCYNGSFDGPTAQISFSDLFFYDLNILECGAEPTFELASGINLDSFFDERFSYDPDIPVAFKNVVVKRCICNRCVGHQAINIYTFDGCVLEDSQANEFSSLENVYGFCFAWNLFGRNLQMFKCQGNRTRFLDPTWYAGGTFTGAIYNESWNVLVKDCQFNDHFGFASTLSVSAGISVSGNSLYENCQFNGTTGGERSYLVNTIHLSDGFQETQATGIKFVNCQFNGATRASNGVGQFGSSFVTGPWFITNGNVVFDHCQASHITTENPSYSAIGFLNATFPQDVVPKYASSKNIIFDGTTVSEISAPLRAVGIWFSVGNLNLVGIQSVLTNTNVRNCVIENVQSTSSSQLVAGIAEAPRFLNNFSVYPAMLNLYISGCRVCDVRAGPNNPLSAGICAQSVIRPEIVDNSISDCDRGVLLTGSDRIVPENLFQLASQVEDALDFPPIPVDLTTAAGLIFADQLFTNTRLGTSVGINGISLLREYLRSTTDLNTLGWKSGDPIVYTNTGVGPSIGGLVSGTTYYLIVYVLGFSERGLIKSNNVSNCSVSGYQDDKPCTSSAWLSNVAFCNGPNGKHNYHINWSKKAPVAKGNLSCYPNPKNNIENISISCCESKH